jgi:hypothetical protein
MKGVEHAKVLDHGRVLTCPNETYEETLGCQRHGRKITVSQGHPWTDEELDATYVLSCDGFNGDTALCDFRCQPHLDARSPRTLPIANQVLKLVLEETRCDKGHLQVSPQYKSSVLQEAHLDLNGRCDDCGTTVPLHALLVRKA